MLKNIEKVLTHINDDLSDLSSSDASDESNEDRLKLSG